MQLDNQTDFAAQIVPLTDKDVRPVAVVVVKATYEMQASGPLSLADEQAPIQMSDEFLGEPGESSVRYESDLAFFKPSTEFVLVGIAYAPEDKPIDSLLVSLRVGPVSKTLRVIGDRRWERRLTGRVKPSHPGPFHSMPLTYERAFGGKDRTHPKESKRGWEPRNPVGTGFRTNRRALIDHPLPNLEEPVSPIRRWKDRPPPASFAFIGRHWTPRGAFAGTYDAKWEAERAPLLPADFDDRYFQAAHPDLTASPHLEGNERVEIINATPPALSPNARLDFDLPGVHVEASAFFRDEEQTANCLLDTVVLCPDEQTLHLVWRTHFHCPRSFNLLEGVEIRSDRGREATSTGREGAT